MNFTETEDYLNDSMSSFDSAISINMSVCGNLTSDYIRVSFNLLYFEVEKNVILEIRMRNN